MSNKWNNNTVQNIIDKNILKKLNKQNSCLNIREQMTIKIMITFIYQNEIKIKFWKLK